MGEGKAVIATVKENTVNEKASVKLIIFIKICDFKSLWHHYVVKHNPILRLGIFGVNKGAILGVILGYFRRFR